MKNTLPLDELAVSQTRHAIRVLRESLSTKIVALQKELYKLNEYELHYRPIEKNDGFLASIVERTDKNSFWPLMREFLGLGYIHEFYDITPLGTYPFGPGRINASAEQGTDSSKLAQAVKNKWFELMRKNS